LNTYKYIARDLQGQRREGHKQAVSSGDVLNWLREQGFTPISVTELAARVRKAKAKARSKRIKSAELAALCWQLTTMVEGGIPITTALETISEDIDNLQLQQLLQKVLKKMLRGETFSSCLAEYPNIFNKLSCSMIMAGETSGNLADALRRLAGYFDNRDKLKKKIQGAMAYPCFVFGFIILIVIVIMTLIVPRFVSIFEQIGSDLPAFTKGFIGFYDFLRVNVIYIIGTAVFVIITTVLTSKTKNGHYFFCRVALKLPLFGKLFAQVFIAMFCRTMASLLGAGVSVLEVFDILISMATNDVIRDAVAGARERIVEGANISASLQSTEFFPNMVVKMINVGEESGSLSKVLERTADYYERKVDSLITTLMALLEPIMIVSVGSIVLVVVIALYLPVFSMSDVK
jgi:type II secretory pathway component PulF